MNFNTLIILFTLIMMSFSIYGKNTKNKKPNIILICADDLGWSDIGCYGSEIHTPNIDKLASQGMRFTSFHNTSKCFPSRASLITGVYAQDCGYHKKYNQPIKNAVTIGEVLRDNGYSTYWSGKHHGAENPITRGFDRYYGLKDGCCNFFNPGAQREGEAQPAQKTAKRAWCIDSTMIRGYTPKEKDFYTTDYFTKYTLEYLDEAAKREQPFFLYLAYTAPHDPLMAWDEDIEKYKHKYHEGFETTRINRYKKQKELGLLDERFKLSTPTHKKWDRLSEKEKQFETKKMQVYAAMIDRMDQNIGKVLKKLNDIGAQNNTIILFVSDNGASAQVVNLKTDNDNGKIGGIDRWVSLGESWANVSNTPFRYYKTNSYEGGIATPLIAWWPNHIKANAISDETGHFIDIMATIVDITEATYPTEHHNESITPLRGVSLLPVLKGKKLKRKSPLFWQWKTGAAMQQGDFKIVKNGMNKPWDLYNIKADPCETNNIAEENSSIVETMSETFDLWHNQYQ